MALGPHFEPLLVLKWSQVGANIGTKTHLNIRRRISTKYCKTNDFFNIFWASRVRVDNEISSKNRQKTGANIEGRFSIDVGRFWGRFWEGFGKQPATKKAPRTHPKNNLEKRFSKTSFGSLLGRSLAALRSGILRE